MLKTLLAAPVLLVPVLWTAPGTPPPPVPMEARLWLEHVPGDAVTLMISAESEEELLGLRVQGPGGRKLAQVDALGSRTSGLSSFELEFSEPDLSALFAAFSPGPYLLSATTSGGGLATTTVRLDPTLPQATQLLQPLDGESVVPSRLTVRWTDVPGASGYEVRLDQDDKEGIIIRLPPAQQSLEVPEGWLAPDSGIVVEVGVIGVNGNMTLTQVEVTTLGG